MSLFKQLWQGRKPVATPSGAEASAKADALIREGHPLEDAGEFDAARNRYQEALSVAPDYWRAYLNLGNLHRKLMQPIEAIRCYERAIELAPHEATGYLNLGNAHMDAGNASEAATRYQEAASLRPDWAEPWFGLGCTLESPASVDAAIDAYRKALELDPGHGMAASNLSRLLLDRGDSLGARRVLTRVLKSNPDNRFAWLALADVEAQVGHADQAIAIYQRPALVAREDFALRSACLFALNFVTDIGADAILADHVQFGHDLAASTAPLPQRLARDPDKRLRIGYVSPDFRRHSVSCFMEPVLTNHDRSVVETYCYYDHTDRDEITTRFEELADHWRDIVGKDDDEVALAIRDDGIDILVDLAGHTAGNRMTLFARRPAPLQFTWLGYLCTTGLSTMDYRICDNHTDPAGQAERWQVESPARMPCSQWCYQPQVQLPVPSPLPMLRNGFCTFGSFNQARKLNEPLLRTWAQALASIFDSRLLVLGVTDHAQAQEIRDTLAMSGIGESRVELVGRIDITEYFKRYRDVDIALDSFPYTGATTTCDALIMGVPVATIAGSRSIARSGASLLHALDLIDWVADSPQSFVELLQRKARAPEQLASLRSCLPDRMRNSPLMDAAAFTRQLEDVYREAWGRQCTT